eukprot:scaffold7510_cov382-Pinguiococcus_pyrenoidosus.AAC.1
MLNVRRSSSKPLRTRIETTCGFRAASVLAHSMMPVVSPIVSPGGPKSTCHVTGVEPCVSTAG